MVKRIWLVIFAVALALSLVIGFLLPVGEGDNGFWWSHLRWFFALFGFVGCVAIVATAKLIGHCWLQRREDHYE